MRRPDFTAVQLTDTHLVGDGERVRGSVDTTSNLMAVLELLVASGSKVDALILSGDLTDDGDPDAYRRLRSAVEPVADALGAALIYAMGNHDDRRAFGSQLSLRDPAEAFDPSLPFDQAHVVQGMRMLVLDSTTPGRHDGKLEQSQLDWLAHELSDPSERGTILVLHHPPIPSPVVTVDHLRLYGADDLADVIVGTDVRMILCGHAHHTAAGVLGGVPVWVGPAVSYRVDPVPPAGRHRGLVGYGFTRVDVFGSNVVATAVEATPAVAVYDESQSDVLDRLAALAPGVG